MSSILKALKKIEESTLSTDTGGPLPAPGAHRLRSPRPPRGRNTRTIIAGALLAAAAGAGFFIFGRDTGIETSPGAARPSGGANAVRAKITDPSLPATAPGPTGPPAAAPAVAPPPPLPKRPPAQALPSRPAARPAPREAPGVPAVDRPPPSTTRAAAPRSAEDSLSRLDNAKLKVMAIAWYTDPAKRIAVINGNLVKEGESVDGYSVRQIRKDDVIVSDGSRSWRVEFGLKAPP